MAQRYFWKAWYTDTTLSEFNGVVTTPFRAIDRSKLIRFGLTDGNREHYFDIFGGQFTINNKVYSFSYGDTHFNLPGREYRDIIQFKDGMSYIALHGKPGTAITRHTFGWKDKIGDLGIQVRYEIPANAEEGFRIRLVSDIDRLDTLRIYRDGNVMASIQAPLSANRAGEAKLTL